LQLQEFTFTVQYQADNRLKHADALSRNPTPTAVEPPNEQTIFRIQEDDWVLSDQFTDDKIKQIHQMSKLVTTATEREIYKNYALCDSPIYCIAARGLQFAVPPWYKAESYARGI